MNATTLRSVLPITMHPFFRVFVYSIEGQAFRVTASEVAEPPLLQGKACYWESRCSPGFYRILLERGDWNLMEKPQVQLKLWQWQTRYAEELADSMFPKTVPPYSSALVWSVTGGAVAQRMAGHGVGELHARWKMMKSLLVSGAVALSGEVPGDRTRREEGMG